MGDFLQDACSWKLNFRLRDGKLRLRVPDTKPTSCGCYEAGRVSKSGQDRESGVAAPAGSTPRLVSRCRHSEHAEQSGAATTASDQRLDILFKSWTWSNMYMVPTFNEPEARKLPAVRLSDQTWRRHVSGVRRVCTGTFSNLRKIMNIYFLKKCRRSVRTYGRVLCCGRRVRSGELRQHSSVWNVRRELDGPPRGGSATLPITHLCLLRDAPPGICFLLLLFYRKSH